MPKSSKHSLRPKDLDELLEEASAKLPKVEVKLDSEHVSTEASLEDYEKAQVAEVSKEFSSEDRDSMSEIILNLRQENESLKEENDNLNKRVIELREQVSNLTVNNKEEYETKIKSLEDENDDLILKNSDLEFKIADMEMKLKTKPPTAINNTKYVRPTNTMAQINPYYQPPNNGYKVWR